MTDSEETSSESDSFYDAEDSLTPRLVTLAKSRILHMEQKYQPPNLFFIFMLLLG